MNISSNTARIHWYMILSCILALIPHGSWIFYLDSCCSLVLLHSSLVSWCDYMSLLLIFMNTHSLLCALVFSVPIFFFELAGHFCYVFDMRLLVYVNIKLIPNFWTPCVSLFQHFEHRMYPHIPYNPQITPGSSTSILSWSSDEYWDGFCALSHFMIPTWWSYTLFLYSAWQSCGFILAKFVYGLAVLLNSYSALRITEVSKAPP